MVLHFSGDALEQCGEARKISAGWVLPATRDRFIGVRPRILRCLKVLQ